jgi:hypothetical protein
MSKLHWIMDIEAARQTSNVVRKPAGRPCSVRLSPIKLPPMTVKTSRIAISCHSKVVDMAFNFEAGTREWND